MSATFSKLVRNGSHTSISSTGSIDLSAHNHALFGTRSISDFSSWLYESWVPINHRHERIAAGALSMGMAVMTREMMEMHVVQAPDVRGMLDCLPAADRSSLKTIGWTQKLGTWPLSKHEALTAKQYAA